MHFEILVVVMPGVDLEHVCQYTAGMKTYRVVGDTAGVSYIPLDKMELDRVMQNTLKECGVELDGFEMKTRYEIVGTKLQRMESMIQNMKDKNEFEPVRLEMHKTGGGTTYVPPSRRKLGVKPTEIPLKISYSVINGRHRIVGSIWAEYTHVPAIVVNNPYTFS